MKDSLREEFLEQFVGENSSSVLYQVHKNIANWWLDKFSTHSIELLSKIEGLPTLNLETFVGETGTEVRGMNNAKRLLDKDQVISLINQEK